MLLSLMNATCYPPTLVMSRCQKYVFPKIKETDIVFRLRKISAEENLDAEWDALDIIASNSDGSLRDAESMLGQLSLLGKQITTSLVNDLTGVVSSESLLDLLITALSSDTVETVKKSRELMESGIDPVALMSQLASLIMDAIAGTSRLPKAQSSSIVLFGESLTEAETERLQRALKILSGAEKQLRLSSERATWFTAALLQIGSGHSPQPTPSCSSSRPSIKRLDLVPPQKIGETSSSDYKSNPSLRLWESSSASVPGNASVHSSISASHSLSDTAYRDDVTSVVNPDKLDAIWRRCIEKCDSERLRRLLHTHGKLVSVTEIRGILIAYIAFSDSNIKSRAERFRRSITNSIALVLRHNVEVRMGLLPEKYLKSLKSFPDSPFSKQSQSIEPGRIHASYDMARRSVDKPRRSQDTIDNREQRGKKTCIDEQRLESAWLQAAENSEAALARNLTESKQEKNHNLVQDGTNSLNQIKSLTDLSISFNHWKDGDGDEIEELESDGSKSCHQRQAGGRFERCHHAISPSLLHSNSFRAKVDRESLGYESEPVQSGLCCWRTPKSNRVKENQGDDTRSQPAGLCFGKC
ncbi:protein STICHEL-like isoform X2 [Asparagus officinalis]|uniref:protein STICHEL-like isoform X2 n=1 Tax=Asparagus officinalis TaxID=4686 RepID=UPI00098E5982|nr:protein STICHEL-like isoform X2 [Asparagus officinalis]